MCERCIESIFRGSMGKLRILVSLITADNDFQIEQGQAAQQAANNLDVSAEIVFADNDAINQSTQILRAIQADPTARPDGIVFEPIGGTALPQVARAAAAANIGWAVLNREATYFEELRRISKAPMFGISSDHAEIGRIQGRQFAVLLPKGGSVLYIQGPSENPAAKERTLGMQETKPPNIHVTLLKGQWTEESAQRTVRSWLKLSTSQKAPIDLIAAQNDAMAVGARKAFQEVTSETERERWLRLPYIGVDGMPKTGQSWVRSGLLTATILTPANAGQAVEMLVQAIRQQKQPPDRVLVPPTSIPALAALGLKR